MAETKHVSVTTTALVVLLCSGAAAYLGMRYERANRPPLTAREVLAECPPSLESLGAREVPLDAAVPRIEAFTGTQEEQARAREVAERAGLMPDGGPVALIRAAARRRNAFHIVDTAVQNGVLSDADRATVMEILPELSAADQSILRERIAVAERGVPAEQQAP